MVTVCPVCVKFGDEVCVGACGPVIRVEAHGCFEFLEEVFLFRGEREECGCGGWLVACASIELSWVKGDGVSQVKVVGVCGGAGMFAFIEYDIVVPDNLLGWPHTTQL